MSPPVQPSDALPAVSRTLLTPGPHPPISHLGLTLLRRAVGTGLRYSFYQLGLPPPEAPPIRLLQLRLFIDAKPLRDLVGERPGGETLLRAVLDPGAALVAPPPPAMRGAIVFHRARQALRPRRRRAVLPRAGGEGGEIYLRIERLIERRSRALADAVLGEILAVLARQEARSKGRCPVPALGPDAIACARGRGGTLAALGVLDPLEPSWDESPALVRRASSQQSGRRWQGRGVFRERYRVFLSELRPLLLALGRAATGSGLIEHPEDIFYVPLPLLDELAGTRRPPWLESAVGTNRAELVRLRGEPEYPDRMLSAPALETGVDCSDGWSSAPLNPLV